MTEALFIVTIVFVAYVVYTVTRGDNDSSVSEAGTDPQAEPVAEAEPQAQAAVVEEAVATVSETTAAKTEKPKKPKATKKSSAPSNNKVVVRNPETGETATVPANYRFTKRWIKELLVEEGLLKKVYKNNELDEKASEKVKKALEKFKKMEKYQA